MNFKAMFEDQRSFNRQIFAAGQSHERQMDRLRSLALGMVEETLDFLRTYEWKSHRRRQGRLQNVAHSHEELVDMFKYWLSCADLAGFPIDQLEELYYAKSRVVQYRYQEEWMQEINGPCVIVDIDNVLAGYAQGICEWVRDHAPSILRMGDLATERFVEHMNELQRSGDWVNDTSTGLNDDEWSQVKHEFRVQGGKRTLPVFSDAKSFLLWCYKQKGWKVILITSRPIDRYPNIFTDTLTWLHNNNLPFDYLWWSDNKANRLGEFKHGNLRSHVVFAVDDDEKYIQQYVTLGIKAYWLKRSGWKNLPIVSQYVNHIKFVETLTQIQEGEEDGRLR